MPGKLEKSWHRCPRPRPREVRTPVSSFAWNAAASVLRYREFCIALLIVLNPHNFYAALTQLQGRHAISIAGGEFLRRTRDARLAV